MLIPKYCQPAVNTTAGPYPCRWGCVSDKTTQGLLKNSKCFCLVWVCVISGIGFAMWKLPQKEYYCFSISGRIFSIFFTMEEWKNSSAYCLHTYIRQCQRNCLHSMLPFKSLKNLIKKSLQFTQQQKEATSECKVIAWATSFKHYMVFQD